MSLPHTLPELLFTPNDYKKYFENIAYSHKEISHIPTKIRFYTNPNAIQGTGLTGPLMCVYPLPLSYSGSRDSLFEVNWFQIWILKPLGSGKQDQLDLLVTECKLIADDIIAKIDKDTEPYNGAAPINYCAFDSLKSEPIDDAMFADKWVGWQFEVGIGNQVRFEYNDSKWR